MKSLGFVFALMILLVAIWAIPAQAQAGVAGNGVTFGPSGFDFLALYDGQVESAGIGLTLAKYNRWHTDGIFEVTPSNNTQTSLGAGLFYDIPVLHLLTISPMIGYQFPITGGTGGVKNIRPAIGLCIVFKVG
jgi:hypothetical protein